jgi:hypothetical protein
VTSSADKMQDLSAAEVVREQNTAPILSPNSISWKAAPMWSFVSAGRTTRSSASMLLALVLSAVMLLVGFALPASGGSPNKVAAAALKDAKQALRRSAEADKEARSARHSIVGTSRLGKGAVTTSRIASGAVTATNLADGSVSLTKLAGLDLTTTVDVPSVDAQTCSTAEVSVPGATVEGFPLVSFPGPVNLPLEISATVLRFDTPGDLRVKFCNGTAVDAAAVVGVNIRVIALS